MVPLMSAVRNPGLSPRDLPVRRLLAALAASLCIHYLLVSGWGDSGGASPAVMMTPPLRARLDPVSVVSPPVAESDVPRVTQSPLSTSSPQPAALPATTAGTKARVSESRSGADSRFYLARELDQYPVPLSVLTLAKEMISSDIRLWVSIDHSGQVVDVAVIDADVTGEYGQLARAHILATRFVPARRDGIPVKSRVLLVLNAGH